MKPILFNTEMVRAILDGRKTCTRRVAFKNDELRPFSSAMYPFGWWYRGRVYETWDNAMNARQGVMERCRYRKNDVLYVRETWKQVTSCPSGGGYDVRDWYLYKADESQDTAGMVVEKRWHPSIHMPKEAARLFLRVTDVRVERLQDMTCDDMLAEGVIPKTVKGGSWQQWQQDYMRPVWNSTIKPPEYGLYSWGANPWVWVIEFECISEKEAKA